MPLVHIAVFIQQPTPFLQEFLERLATLNYPHTRLRLFIHNNVCVHRQDISTSLCCCYVYTLVTVIDCVCAGCVSWAACGEILVTSSLSVSRSQDCWARGKPPAGSGQDYGSVNTHTYTRSQRGLCCVWISKCDSWPCFSVSCAGRMCPVIISSVSTLTWLWPILMFYRFSFKRTSEWTLMLFVCLRFHHWEGWSETNILLSFIHSHVL